MHLELINLVNDINQIRNSSKPVALAWNKACDKISATKEWREFGKLFLTHPDLVHSDNAYHNHYHSAEAILSGAYLACAEFSEPYNLSNTYNKQILIFAMMGHDVAHNGGHNTYPYELEIKAFDSLKYFAHSKPCIKEFWDKNLAKDYGTWGNFLSIVETIILGTDFKSGPKENAQNYRYNNSIAQLKMLANEADILPSCIEQLGPERGLMLSVEQNKPEIISSRASFLSKAVYVSEASKKLDICSHINEQIHEIKPSPIKLKH